MVTNDIKIFLKMENKGWLGIENKKIKYEKKNYFADKD